MSVAESVTNSQVDEGFETELIDRFFNPKSYFLTRFLNAMRERESAESNPLDVVAVGLIVDQIIAAEDKKAVLESLDRFPTFRRYHEQLRQGIEFLQNGRLNTQQMMDVVGALAVSLADSLLELVQEEASRDELLNMLGIAPETPAPSVAPETVPEEAEEPAVEEQPVQAEEEPTNGEIGEAPWSYFRDDIEQKLHLLERHIERFARHPGDWAVFKQIKDDFRDLRDWSMIQGDEGIEAISHKILLLFEAVYMRGPEHRARILPVLQNALETLKEVNRAGRGSERLDIVRVMVHQIERQRRIYPEVLDEVPQSAPEKSAEAPPTAAPRAEEPPRSPGQESGATEPSFEKTFAEDAAGDPITSEMEFVEAEGSPLRDEEAPSGTEPAAAEPVKDEIRESELLSELISEHGDELRELDLPELESIEDSAAPAAEESPEELHLPGEDDAELMAILEELKQEQKRLDEESGGSQLVADMGGGDSAFDRYVARLEEEYESEVMGQEKPVPGGEPSGPPEKEAARSAPEPLKEEQEPPAGAAASPPESRPEPESGASGQDFVAEADMYFTFGRKALQNLMKDPDNRQALEDLELATYSLKILAERLGYRSVAEAFSLAEQLVQSRIENKIGLKPEQVNALVSLVHEIEQAGREQGLQDPARQRWLKKQIDTLRSWVGPSASPKKAGGSGESGRKTGEDPLDFLLFDDTSKFFKNLLSE